MIYPERYMVPGGHGIKQHDAGLLYRRVDVDPIIETLRQRAEQAEAERDEARRRRDEWRAKAEGYDEVRRALREKVGAPWPPNMSRILWAGIAADEKQRADDAEAERDAERETYDKMRKVRELGRRRRMAKMTEEEALATWPELSESLKDMVKDA